MNARPDPASFRLAAREVIDIHDGAGLVVTCVSGALWITQADDPEDIVLKRGQSFTLDRPGLALVSAPVGPAAGVIGGATRDHAGHALRSAA